MAHQFVRSSVVAFGDYRIDERRCDTYPILLAHGQVPGDVIFKYSLAHSQK